MRERLLRHGAPALTDAELLALLTHLPGGATSAERLLATTGGLRPLVTNCPRNLTTLPGLGLARATALLAALELGRRVMQQPSAARPFIGSADLAYAYLAPTLQALRHEVFHVLCLNSRKALLFDARVSQGTVDSCPVDPREVFAAALSCGASCLILAHNHPSGVPEPSPEDIVLTRRLAEGGKTLGIQVLDHLIIGDGRYVSFHERRLMPGMDAGVLHEARR